MRAGVCHPFARMSVGRLRAHRSPLQKATFAGLRSRRRRQGPLLSLQFETQAKAEAMIRAVYDWTMTWAAHRHASAVLAVVAFIESSIFPIPPDVLLVPMVLADRARAWAYALLCTVASVLGGLAGYMIGAFFFESVARPILDAYGYADAFASFTSRYNDWGAWIVFIAGVTPFPYKVITIASGATGLSLPVFMIASVLSRGLRFFIVAAILWKVGPPARAFIERRLGLLFALFCALLVGGFAVVKCTL